MKLFDSVRISMVYTLKFHVLHCLAEERWVLLNISVSGIFVLKPFSTHTKRVFL